MQDWTGPTAVSGLTVITLILVLSFAIDRIVAASMFLLSFSAGWNRRFPEPALLESPRERLNAEKRLKLIYFLFAGTLAVGILIFADHVRVLTALGFRSTKPDVVATPTASPTPTGSPGQTQTPFPTPSPSPSASPGSPSSVPEDSYWPFSVLDFVITGLILVGGADRIEHLFRLSSRSGGGSRDESKPLEIKGKITIDDQSGK